MKKKGRLLIALAIVIVMTLSIVLMACDDTGFKVTFVTNEGTAVAELTNCKTIETEPTTSRAGYTFKGWYTNAELSGNRVTFPFTVTADTTLYASWEKNADEPDPEEPDVPKFTSAGQVFNTAATMLYSTLTDVIGSLNSKTLGYDINAVLGLNGTKHHLDISTAINLENVGVGALVNYESVTGEVSNKEIMVQVHDGAVYYKNGDQAVKMPFLGIDSLLALVVGEGIDISAITGAWDSVESYIGILGGVLFNEAFTYDKATNSATISVSNDILAGKLDTIFGLLPGNLNVQKIIDELAYNSLGIPYEINLQELVSAFNFNLELTLDLTEEDALENFGVVLTLGESNLEFKKLASCPTYDAEGNRTVVYERKEPVGEATEGEIITRELKIPANEISFDIAVNDRTTEIAAPEGDFNEVNLLNFDVTGKVFFKDSDNESNTQEATMMLKSDLDITKLMSIVDGKLVPTPNTFADAGYFRFNITSLAEGVGTLMEIVYDPTNSGNTQAYVYVRLGPNTTTNPTTIRLTYEISELVEWINLKATEQKTVALAEPNNVDSVVNGLVGIIGKLVGDIVITDGLTLGQITNGITYSYNDGLSVNVAFLDKLFEKLGVSGVVSSKLFVGEGRDTIVVKVETFNWLGADAEYNAFDQCKNLEFATGATLNNISLDYMDSLDSYLAANVNNMQGIISYSDGTSKQGNFTVVKTVGYDPTKSGEQTITVYGYSSHPNDAFLVGILAGFVDIPFGMIKTTLTVNVGEKVDAELLTFDIDNSAPVWLRYDSKGLLTVNKSTILRQLAPKLVYKTGAGESINIASAYCKFIDEAGNIVSEIKEVGNYTLRATKLGIDWNLPFDVYSTNLPATAFDNNSITVGESIEKIISNYYYSYPSEKGIVKANFTLNDVKLIRSENDTTDILVNGAIPVGTTITSGIVVFSVEIDNETYTFNVNSGLIKQQPGYTAVTNRWNAVTGSSTVNWLIDGLAMYGADGGRKGLAMSFNNGTKKVELAGTSDSVIYADNVTLKFFNAANEDITDSVYNAETGIFTVTEAIANSTVTMKAEFTTLDTAAQGQWKNITTSFEAEIMCDALLTGIPTSKATSAVEDGNLNGVLALNKASESGNSQEYTLKLDTTDNKYYFMFGNTKGEEVEIKFESNGVDATATVMTNGILNKVSADTKYTLIAYIGGEEVYSGDFTVINKAASLKAPASITVADGELVNIPLTYTDSEGVANEIFLTFKARLQVDIDGNWSPVYEANKFYLAIDGETPFTDGRPLTAGEMMGYKPVVITSIALEAAMGDAYNAVGLDLTTGKFTKNADITHYGAVLKITVTIYEVEYSLNIAVY